MKAQLRRRRLAFRSIVLFLPAFLSLLFIGASGGCLSRNATANNNDNNNNNGNVVQPQFADIAAAAGLNYKWEISGKRPLNILQTIGNGCAFLDFDNDGNLDILLVGPKPALYKGDGAGHFLDVSQAMGLATLSGHFLGCAVGDYDGDTFPDIYLTAYRGGALLHNAGGKSFQVVANSGIPAQPWATSAVFGDVNGDGRLDLFVGNYVKFDSKTEPQLCPEGGIPTSCGPRHYKPEKNALYINKGNGAFRDATKEFGIGASTGKALGAAFAPLLDDDGRLFLKLANDEMPGDLMRPSANSGLKKRFANVGAESGVAYDNNGNVHGGMGVDWGDSDNDGRLDLFVSTFQNETKCVYHNDGDGLFNEQSAQLGVDAATNPFVAFGVKWLDFDNDGWLDLAVANGHVQDNIAEIDASTMYRQSAQLLQNVGGRQFSDVSAQAGKDFTRPVVGRGLATGDFDNDGRTDLLVVDSEGAPLLLHNRTKTDNNWIGFALLGKGAEGATVTVTLPPDPAGNDKTSATLRRTRLSTTGGSYMSASDARPVFGLGSGRAIERVTVRWADGTSESWVADLATNRYRTLARGSGTKSDTTAAAQSAR